MSKGEQIKISFDGIPKVEILGEENKEYRVEFIDNSTQELIHHTTIKNNMWAVCNRRWYTPWKIRINGEDKLIFNLENKEVKISLQSKSIGDTLAWVPQALEFSKRYKCKVTVSTFHNKWFKNLKKYKNLKFTEPEESGIFYAHYLIGWFKTNEQWDEGSYHPIKPNTIPLIQAATDILGLPYKEINYGVDFKPKERPLPTKYICIGPRSTAGLKEWPHHYWGELAGLLKNDGYKVINISYEGFQMPDIIDRKELNWEDTYNYLYHADLFIGLGSGLSWFNWAMNKHTIMINNFIPYGYEMTHNTTKIEDYSVCNNCWVKPQHIFNPGDCNWCPEHQNTPLQHICHKNISPQKVYKKITQILKFKNNN